MQVTAERDRIDFREVCVLKKEENSGTSRCCVSVTVENGKLKFHAIFENVILTFDRSRQRKKKSSQDKGQSHFFHEEPIRLSQVTHRTRLTKISLESLTNLLLVVELRRILVSTSLISQ